jgi:hypothetical protein
MAALTTKSRREIFPDLFSKYGLRLIRTLVINDHETEMAERRSSATRALSFIYDCLPLVSTWQFVKRKVNG